MQNNHKLAFWRSHDGFNEEEPPASLVDRLHKTSSAFGMKIGGEKSKLMTNNTDGISINITVNGKKKKLNECDSFKDQGAVVTVQGFNLTYCPELRRQQQH